MKKQIMKRAWEIRKAAAFEMDCKSSTVCFSICLKLAWKESRKVKAINVKFNGYADAKGWAARITGKCQRWVLKRDFVKTGRTDFSGSGQTFYHNITVNEGEVFQTFDGYKKRFVTCQNGIELALTQSEVKELFN